MTTGRKILLSIAVTAAFFLLLEGLLALAGFRAVSYSGDPYVGFSSTSKLFIETTAEDGHREMATSEAKLSLFNRQHFPSHKDGAFRIFCVGGSTTFGRPYDHETSFCGWLQELLPIADPSRQWEVINAGGVSYASYRVALLMEELVEYEPDLFVIYSGHNEFLERRSYPQIIATPRAVRGLGSVLSKTRLWSALSDVVGSTSGVTEGPEDNPDLLTEEVTTLLDGAVGPGAYTRDDELAGKILQHYRFNLARMAEIAASVDAGTVYITPAANLKDSRPFKSEHSADLAEAARRRFDELVEGARVARGEGRLAESMDQIIAAATLDPRHAQLAFLEGSLLGESERWGDARQAFERARDQDVCPLRAVGSMSGVVRDVARDHGSTLVDFEVLADEWAEAPVPGADLFLDHVHPKIDVHRRLALAVVEAMAEDGIVRIGPGWNETSINAVTARVESGIDNQDHALALMKLSKVLGWAGKLDESYRLAMQAVDLYPEDARVQYNAGLTAHLSGRKAQAVAHYRRAVEIQPDADEPHGNLGVLLEEGGLVDEAIVHYRLAIRYARSTETTTRNSANLARALLASGFTDYSAGRVTDALEKFTEAAEIAPGDVEILGRLAIAQLASGRSAEAVETLETATRILPEDPVLVNRLALAQALEGRADLAATTYARALQLDPGVADLPDNLFRVLDRLGRADLAAEIRVRLEAE